MIRRVLLLALLAAVCWLPAAAQESTPTSTPAGLTIHVVQRGETLYLIATSYGMTIDELATLNGITDPGNIQVGQRLLVPSTDFVQPVTHTVQAGETMQSIAALYGIDAQTLAAQNNVTDLNTIYVGQLLTISNGSNGASAAGSTPTGAQSDATSVPTTVAQAAAPSVVVHIVASGETLFRIATQYGLTVNEVAAANGIADPTLIYVGQQLVIPGVQPPQLALDLPPHVTGLDIMPQFLVEGQTGRFRMTTDEPMTVSGTFLGRALNVATEQNSTLDIALVGVPIFTTAGIYPLNLTFSDASGAQEPLAVNIQVLAGGYGQEYITLNSSLTELLDPVGEQAEQAILQPLMSAFTPQRYFDGLFGLPVAAVMTSPFGTRRSYDGGPFDHFHAGVDFGAVPGTPIIAPAPGRVVVAEDRFPIRGMATVIDHGWGVFTGYWHQSERDVQLGDMVSAGQVIGLVGDTGRVTGPHLHWEMWVGGVPVDPMQWVRQPFP